MNLNSFYFPIFLFAVLLLEFLIQVVARLFKRNFFRAQIALLVFASFIFISIFDIRFFVVLFLEIIFVYFFALQISCAKNKKVLVVISIVTLVLILAYFKYMNFFIESIARIFLISHTTAKIILPLGISFYTFTSIAYIVDVANGKTNAEKNFLDFALFMSFFPKIFSGPILRANEFLPQIKNYSGLKTSDIKMGAQIFTFGLFKKIVLADHLAVFVDDVFSSPLAFNWATVILAIFSYSLQIYFDFSGYTDMAIGTAKTLGFDLRANFNLPYIAKNPSEFWKRWHISLSEWLRDYIYFPLGGSKRGKARTLLNLVLVMTISGLWHGSSWTFVAWGFLHGVFSCIEKIFGDFFSRKKFFSAISIVVTFAVTSILWVFFRAENFQKAFAVLRAAFGFQSGISQPYFWSVFSFFALEAGTLIAKIKSKKSQVTDLEKICCTNGFYPIVNLDRVFGKTAFFIFLGITIILGYYGETAFIYGKF